MWRSPTVTYNYKEIKSGQVQGYFMPGVKGTADDLPITHALASKTLKRASQRIFIVFISLTLNSPVLLVTIDSCWLSTDSKKVYLS